MRPPLIIRHRGDRSARISCVGISRAPVCPSSQTAQITPTVNKGERISRFVEELEGSAPEAATGEISQHPCYRGFFRCWNEQRYYEAHDVLEHLWLETASEDANFFKGLIQAAGGFVHLKLHFEDPAHRVHGRRLGPAVRLFAMAEANLEPYGATRHAFDIDGLRALLARTAQAIVDSEFTRNPWSPVTAPQLKLK
jgi:predicted metal-dependent hydrolase